MGPCPTAREWRGLCFALTEPVVAATHPCDSSCRSLARHAAVHLKNQICTSTGVPAAAVLETQAPLPRGSSSVSWVATTCWHYAMMTATADLQAMPSTSMAPDRACSTNTMRRAASAPALRAACEPRRCACAAACGCLEVYVVSRAFTEFGGGLFRRMTPEMKRSLMDLGICHYMTVFRTPDGKYVQFDFGPKGGDVEKVNGPLGAWLRAARRQQQQEQQSSGPGGLRASPSAPVLELSAALAAAVEEDGCCGRSGGQQGRGR